jgi:hypothetical protein
MEPSAMTMLAVIKPACVAVALAFAASSAAAATLFSDDFDRPDSKSVGGGWSELERAPNDVFVNNGMLRLRDFRDGNPDAAASSMVIDATGYENVTVSFNWRTNSSNTASDSLFLSWTSVAAPAIDDTSAWTQAFKGGVDGDAHWSPEAWSTETITLTGAANGKFNLLFWTDVDAANRGFRIDYVTVTGDKLVAGAVAPVPLPAGLPLLVGGLAAFGLMKRRRARG